MNKARRTSLKEASHLLDRAIDIISDVRSDEQDCLDNMPENLQNSERCENMENAIDHLDDAIDRISEAQDGICEAIA